MANSNSHIEPLWIPPPKVFSLQTHDRQQIDHLNDLTFLSVAFKPLRKEPFYLDAKGVHGGAITQWTTDAPFGFVSSPKVALDKVTIRFVANGGIIRRNSFAEYLGTPGKAMFVAFEEMVTEEASAGFQAFAGTIDRSALMSGHVALEGSDEFAFPCFQPVVDISGAAMRAFRHNFYLVYERLNAGVDEHDLSFPLLQEMIIYQFLAAWPRSSPLDEGNVVLRPSWQVRRALDYIDANLQRKITLAEIAVAAGIGVRSLQASFRKELGKTPIQWITERRLAGVHKELIDPPHIEASIAEVARRWGFTHLGDFSRKYRERYGDTPLKSKRGVDYPQ
ncbi:helix-turn-helix transcriptional regulator [Rhizobiaceae bacterium CRRU44]|uniref:Helix-turn-helix transcriptional regulator n=1 Tax=Ferranicluibacter rubi TaxID=2715133 RepID=A0AA43ZIY4_9HYPH|nr:helix-turn-helix transcriptional regulator [Ferranicluibacter rubi]NHT77813.1 helix-turn-helix transcriptional regulator [Ferranicluibacter rubi]